MKYILVLIIVSSCAGTITKSDALPGDLGTFDPYENNSRRIK